VLYNKQGDLYNQIQDDFTNAPNSSSRFSRCWSVSYIWCDSYYASQI